MIHSMTAFARRTAQHPWGTAVWEIRSVNHRYLELTLRLPETLRELETPIRERIKQHLQRGKIECYLKYQPLGADLNTLTVNHALVEQLATTATKVKAFFPNTAPINIMDVLSWPEVLRINETQTAIGTPSLLELFDATLKDLVTARAQEGKALHDIIVKRLKETLQLTEKIKKRLPLTLENQRKKIIARLEEMKTQLNPERVEQEMVLLAQKMDIAEELDRIKIHVDEANRVLREDKAAGKRLDFLLQELNREANTLASKSMDGPISAAAVDLKVLIEQMREQIQNIE